MAYDLARLASYVRFYQTVVKQLGAAWENLARIHGVAREALAAFPEPLLTPPWSSSRALAEALAAPTAHEAALGALFRPEDEEALGAIDDVYAVVGHFSFQGDENENLARVQALVSGARNEIVAQRMRLADLGKLPAEARAVASRLEDTEGARAGAERAERTASFEPLAEDVQKRARQTTDALHAVPFPDLANAETAAEEYRRYAAKLDQVYQTCLPFLRKAIAALYAFVGCEPTASWPDVLPITRELPAELVTVPPADSAELSQARASVSALAEEELRLGRARDEIATTIARFEGELAAAGVRDKEIEVEATTASRIGDYAAAIEQGEAVRRALAAAEQQKAERVRAAGEVMARARGIEAAIKLLEQELAARQAELAQSGEALAAEKKGEPVLFGKDDWRARVAALEAQIEALRAIYAQRQGTLNGQRIDLSSVSVGVQTEQQQAMLVDRSIAESRATLEAIQKTLRDLGAALGVQRPARKVTPAEASEAAVALQQARVENAQRAERLRGEVRRQKEETVRVLTRLKQIGVERQQVSAMVQSAQVAATEGHEEALRHLAAQRRAAVERHAGEVLGTLDKSLALVGPVFVEPARKVMVDASAPRPEASAAVLEGAEKLAPVVEKLARELDPELLAQDAALGQIQREFCDVALSACRAAWS
jgi:hypothetical protein